MPRTFVSPALLGLCLAALLLAGAQAADYKFAGRQSTPGNDISCGQKDKDGKPQSFCKICDGLAALADACDANAECKGFDMEGSYCGYLKGAAGQGKTQYMEGFSHYCKLGAAGNSCAGDYTIRRRSDVVGQDVNCNAKKYNGEKLDYCEVSGSATEVAAACTANANCKAFSMGRYSGGRLKTASSPTTYTEGSTVYVRA